MNAVLDQFSEKVAFHIGFHDAAREIDGKGVFKTDDGAVGTGRKRLAHVNIKTLDIGFHVFRYFQCAHICQSGGRIFILYFRIKCADNEILDKKRNDADNGIALRSGVRRDIAPKELFADIIFHVMMYLLNDFLKSIIAQSWVDGRVDHRDKISEGLRRKKTPQINGHRNLDGPYLIGSVIFLLLHEVIQQDSRSLLHVGRCRRIAVCRARWSPYP